MRGPRSSIRQYAGVLFLVIIRFSPAEKSYGVFAREKWHPRKRGAAGRLAPVNATRNVGRYLCPQKPYVLLLSEGNFVPAKNTVAITFEKGAELVASQGWVKATIKGVTDYYYLVNTKASETAALDNIADIIIKSIKVTSYGRSAAALNLKYVGTASDGKTGYSAQTKGEPVLANDKAIAGNYFSLDMLKANTSAIAYMCFDYG